MTGPSFIAIEVASGSNPFVDTASSVKASCLGKTDPTMASSLVTEQVRTASFEASKDTIASGASLVSVKVDDSSIEQESRAHIHLCYFHCRLASRQAFLQACP